MAVAREPHRRRSTEPRLLVEGLPTVLQSFAERWRRERPATVQRSGVQATGTVGEFTAFRWLAQESGVSVSYLERLATGAGQRTRASLQVADAIVAALERPELFHDETLVVVRRTRAGYVRVDGDDPNSLTG